MIRKLLKKIGLTSKILGKELREFLLKTFNEKKNYKKNNQKN